MSTIQAFRMHLKPGNEAEYARRHAQLWPEMKELLKQAVQINPKFTVAWENLASLYLSRAKMSYEEAAGAGSKTAAERAGAVQALITGKPAAAAQEQTAAASGGTGSTGITVRTVEAGDIKLETARPEEIRTAQ